MISPVELITRIIIFTPHPHPPILGCYVTPIPEEPTQPSTSEFDQIDQFFTHGETDLRHAVHAAYLACLEESELPS